MRHKVNTLLIYLQFVFHIAKYFQSPTDWKDSDYKSTSIHFLKTVYKEKMSIYPIINYPLFSENTIIFEFRSNDMCLCLVKLQIAEQFRITGGWNMKS